MSDFQGALKELIMPREEAPTARAQKPWVTGQKGNNVIKKVRARHKHVIALHMAGWRNGEIARELGYTEARVSVILNSPNQGLLDYRSEVENQVAQQTGDLVLAFHAESRASLNKLVEIRNDLTAPRSEQRLSALAILDRAGYSPVKKQMNLNTDVPVQELKSIMGQIDHANEVASRKAEWQIAVVEKPEGV